MVVQGKSQLKGQSHQENQGSLPPWWPHWGWSSRGWRSTLFVWLMVFEHWQQVAWPWVADISPHWSHKLLGVEFHFLRRVTGPPLSTLTLVHFPSSRESLSFASVSNQTLLHSVLNSDLFSFVLFGFGAWGWTWDLAHTKHTVFHWPVPLGLVQLWMDASLWCRGGIHEGTHMYQYMSTWKPEVNPETVCEEPFHLNFLRASH